MTLVNPTVKEIAKAVRENDVVELKSLCQRGTITTFSDNGKEFHWLCKAMDKHASIEILKVLIEGGVDPHAMPKSKVGPVCHSVRQGNVKYLQFLLKIGVDPNADFDYQRPTISVVNSEATAETQIEMLRLLIQRGVDVNHEFRSFGDENNLFTVFDRSKHDEVRAYLRSVGAKTAAELSGKPSATRAARKDPLLNEVHQYMADKFGPPEEKSFTDMLNVGSGVMVHVIKPAKRGDPLTLFTTGLSANPMKVPPELTELTGGQSEIYGEVYMQLPGNWKFTRSGTKWTWPMQHLSNLAAYPHAADAFYAFVTTIDNDDPPQPLGPKVSFNATMLLVDDDFTRSDGKTVYFYSVIPIYASEAALGHQDINQLLDVMETNNISRVLDLKRKPFV